MAQARVTDFGGGLGDVIASASQKFGGALHPKLSQILRNGQANFARKTSAQIKRATADFAAEHFQSRRLSQIAREQFLRSLHAIADRKSTRLNSSHSQISY